MLDCDGDNYVDLAEFRYICEYVRLTRVNITHAFSTFAACQQDAHHRRPSIYATLAFALRSILFATIKVLKPRAQTFVARAFPQVEAFMRQPYYRYVDEGRLYDTSLHPCRSDPLSAGGLSTCH